MYSIKEKYVNVFTLALRERIFPVELPIGMLTGSSYRLSTLRKKLLIDSSYTPCCKIKNTRIYSQYSHAQENSVHTLNSTICQLFKFYAGLSCS